MFRVDLERMKECVFETYSWVEAMFEHSYLHNAFRWNLYNELDTSTALLCLAQMTAQMPANLTL